MARTVKERVDRCRAEKIGKGECLQCHEKVVPGKRHCGAHLAYRAMVSARYNFFHKTKRNEYVRLWRHKRRAIQLAVAKAVAEKERQGG